MLPFLLLVVLTCSNSLSNNHSFCLSQTWVQSSRSSCVNSFPICWRLTSWLWKRSMGIRWPAGACWSTSRWAHVWLMIILISILLSCILKKRFFTNLSGIYQDISGRRPSTPQIHATGNAVLLIYGIHLGPVTKCHVVELMFWLIQATAEANNLAAVASAKDQYYKNMEKVRLLHAHYMYNVLHTHYTVCTISTVPFKRSIHHIIAEWKLILILGLCE